MAPSTVSRLAPVTPGALPGSPFTVRIASSLRGMALELPDPLSKPADEAMLVRGDIRFMPGGERIESEGVDSERGVFTQAFGSTALDAAALQIPSIGFLPPNDPRVLATIEAIDRDLGVNGHIYRYRSDDGLEGDEGSFVFCTLWMVQALARSGQVERAKERFEMVLAHANDLGLLAEEIDPRSGEQLGNFPQAFSHVGVISAALAIEAAEKHAGDWVPGEPAAR